MSLDRTGPDPLDSLLEDIDESDLFKPAPAVGFPEPIPEVTFDSLVCLRGPCRHYLELHQRFESGNTKGSPGANMMIKLRYCMVHKGGEPTELTDQCIYKCNKWDPENKDFVSARNLRRKNWKEVAELNEVEGLDELDT